MSEIKLRKFKENEVVTFVDSDNKKDRGIILKVIEDGRFYHIKSLNKNSRVRNHWFIPSTNIVRV